MGRNRKSEWRRGVNKIKMSLVFQNIKKVNNTYHRVNNIIALYINSTGMHWNIIAAVFATTDWWNICVCGCCYSKTLAETVTARWNKRREEVGGWGLQLWHYCCLFFTLQQCRDWMQFPSENMVLSLKWYWQRMKEANHMAGRGQVERWLEMKKCAGIIRRIEGK